MQKFVKKEILDYKEPIQNYLVVWRSASVKLGVLSVIMAGLSMMPMLSAGS